MDFLASDPCQSGRELRNTLTKKTFDEQMDNGNNKTDFFDFCGLCS